MISKNKKENHQIISRKQIWILASLVSLLAFFLYLNTVNNGYALDDYSVIAENSVTVKGVESIPVIFQNFYRYGYSIQNDGIYRPLSVAMFALEWQISPNNPALSHWVNVIFYSLTGWVLFITLCRLLKNYNIVLPFIISVLFIAHPIHTEVVANIKSRDELMCFFLSITSIYFVLRYFDKNSVMNLLISFGLFFCALLAKETAITMVIVIPVTLYFFTQ